LGGGTAPEVVVRNLRERHIIIIYKLTESTNFLVGGIGVSNCLLNFLFKGYKILPVERVRMSEMAGPAINPRDLLIKLGASRIGISKGGGPSACGRGGRDGVVASSCWYEEMKDVIYVAF